LIESTFFFITASGLKAGYIALKQEHTGIIIGPGCLYDQGCDIGIIFSLAFGVPPVRKFTIAGHSHSVNQLLPYLAKHEAGWGGRENIIGSPRNGGSNLSENIIIELVRHHA
jgi:hypothetical protein